MSTPMITVLDTASAEEQLGTSTGPVCPGCGGRLAPWGYARARAVRGLDVRIRVRPRRGRCRDCRRTQVLLPASCLPHRGVGVEVVGAALLAAARGAGHRRVATDLELPADTVRGWLRRARLQAPWLRARGTKILHEFDPAPTWLQPTGNVLGDAVDALGAATAAVVRRLGDSKPPWQLINQLVGGLLVARTAPAIA